MRKISFFSLFAMALLAILSSCGKSTQTNAKEAPELKTRIDTISYLFGYSNGKNWKNQGLDEMEMSVFIGAMNEAYEGKEPKVELMEGGKIVKEYIDGKRKIVLEENLKKSDEFLAKNGKRDGVITTDSGLQYEVLKEGNGPKPKLTDLVKVYFKGETIDGKVFDETEEGKPYEQYANRVIRGWSEGLQLMPVGSTYKFFIPPGLAYGQNGTPTIEPNSALIFEIELLEIVPSEEAVTPQVK